MTNIQLAKQLIRAEIKFIVKSLSDTQIKTQSKTIEQKVLISDWFNKSQRISFYVSTQSEVITDNIIKEALKLKKDVFIPRFEKGSIEMQMTKLQSLDEFLKLGPSVWGIKQHSKSAHAEHYQITGPLDLVIVPAYAFTLDGKRLGKGKGYYDRFFDSHQKFFKTMPKIVGIALKQQIVEDLPTERFDVPVDIVITP